MLDLISIEKSKYQIDNRIRRADRITHYACMCTNLELIRKLGLDKSVKKNTLDTLGR